MRKFKLNQQRGDTMVEVLISIAVAGLVLGVTYATMNRNLLVSRDSQERTEATKIVQGQIELLKAHYDNNDTTLTGSFCLNETSNIALNVSSCVNLGVSGLYNITIVANGGGLYHFYVRWSSIKGDGSQNQVEMVYKV